VTSWFLVELLFIVLLEESVLELSFISLSQPQEAKKIRDKNAIERIVFFII
jgi:hypothetical protein